MTEQEERLESILKKLDVVELKNMPGYKCRNILFNNIVPLFNCSIRKGMLRAIKRVFFDSAEIIYKHEQSKLLLVSYDYDRMDHRAYWEMVRQLFEGYSELVVTDKSRKVVPVWQWPVSIYNYFAFLKALKRAELDGVRFVLASDLIRTYRIIRKLDRLKLSQSASLIFFDGNCTENTIVQYLSRQGVNTVTMQHGQPVFHGCGRDHLNQTMILNMTADYVIVPGEFSKKQFMAGGIDEKRIKVLGTLRLREEYKDSESNIFVVFLNSPTFDFSEKSNLELIQIAEVVAQRLNLTYIIRLHPQDDVHDYSNLKVKRGTFVKKDISLAEILDKVAFSVLNFSGVYIDSIAKGKKSFVLKKYVDYYMADSDLDLFLDVFSLEEKIKLWNEMDTADKKNYISDMQYYYLGSDNSAKLHKEFVASIMCEI